MTPAALTEAERRDLARRHLDTAEAWLRRLVDQKLTTAFGTEYLAPGDAGTCPLVSKATRKRIADRFDSDRSRFSRTVDAADLGDAISIVLNPELYRAYFRPALISAFPDGPDEARTFLSRLENIRNKLAHGGTCSDRDVERAVCYSNDLIDSIKQHFSEQNMGREFNVPTLIRVVDNKGNDFHLHPSPRSHDIDVRDQGNGDLQVGDELLIEVEVDPSFSNYSIDWRILSTNEAGHGSPMHLQIGPKHVGTVMIAQIKVKSAEEWHRFSDSDDDVILRYRVLPPTK
jgi:hypothetical protein